jgi:hypothetical protein
LSQQFLNLTPQNSGLGDNPFTGGTKINANFTELYGRTGGTTPSINSFVIGNQTPVAGSKMQVDNLFESSTFPLMNEGSIWPQTTYAFAGFSKEFTATTVSGAGGSPLATIFAFANNNNCAGDVTAIIGDAVDRTGGATIFAANFVARNAAGISGTKLVGLEIDIEPAASSVPNSNSCGLIFNIYNIAAADPTPVCTVGGVGGGVWGNGFLTSHIAGAHYAVQSGDPIQSVSFINTTNASTGFSTAAIMLGQGAAQGINLGGSAFGTSPYLYGDSSGNLNFNSGTGGLLAFRNVGGTLTSTISGITGAANFAGTAPAVKIAGAQVVGARNTGWTAFTGATDKSTAFDPSSVTLAQLAARVSALQIAFTTHGLIGT